MVVDLGGTLQTTFCRLHVLSIMHSEIQIDNYICQMSFSSQEVLLISRFTGYLNMVNLRNFGRQREDHGEVETSTKLSSVSLRSYSARV